jgi:hypothetical protein
MMYCARCEACGFDENKSYFELNDCLYLIPKDIKDHIDSLQGKCDALEEEIHTVCD